jgi:Uma2 family endonuclease
LLVVEVADTSLAYDRDVKVPLYAAHGIPEVWLVDLRHRRLDMFRDPGPDGYRQILRPDASQVVAPLLLPTLAGLTVAAHGSNVVEKRSH